MATSSTSPSTNIIRQNWGKLHDILERIADVCFISFVGKLYQDEIISGKERRDIVRKSEYHRGKAVDDVLDTMERYIDKTKDKGKTKKLLSIMKSEEWLEKKAEDMEQGIYILDSTVHCSTEKKIILLQNMI